MKLPQLETIRKKFNFLNKKQKEFLSGKSVNIDAVQEKFWDAALEYLKVSRENGVEPYMSDKVKETCLQLEKKRSALVTDPTLNMKIERLATLNLQGSLTNEEKNEREELRKDLRDFLP